MIRPVFSLHFTVRQFCSDFINILFQIENFSLVYLIEELYSKNDIILYEVEFFLFSVDFLIKIKKCYRIILFLINFLKKFILTLILN